MHIYTCLAFFLSSADKFKTLLVNNGWMRSEGLANQMQLSIMIQIFVSQQIIKYIEPASLACLHTSLSIVLCSYIEISGCLNTVISKSNWKDLFSHVVVA